jgi:lysophospholipase L1-like esterase
MIFKKKESDIRLTFALIPAAAFAMACVSMPAVAETVAMAPSSANAPAAFAQNADTASPHATVATASQPSQSNSDQGKGVAAKAIDAAKGAAKDIAQEASDILARAPCLTVKGAAKLKASLPHVARRIAANEPVTIVALGSSSTQGFGSSSPDHNYPNRLAAQLRRKFPNAEINVINRGVGGQDTREMLARLDSVLELKPDLVMWQLGTNTVVRGVDMTGTEEMVDDGVARLQAHDADVVLIDPQYVPAVNAKMDGASKMVQLIQKVADLRHVSVFPRFEIMREWHDDEKMPFESFVISDGLHMNDWGYACFAQLLGDTIIRSVGQVNSGTDKPANVLTYRPKEKESVR